METPPSAKPRVKAETLAMNTGVFHILEREANNEIVIGISTPVPSVTMRRPPKIEEINVSAD